MREQKTEQWLEKKAIDFRYQQIPLKVIKDDGDARANIRLGRGLTTERVEEYAAKLQSGVEFPAVILKPLDSLEYIIIAGMHRIAAMRSIDRTEIDAYVITSDLDELMTEYLQRASNVLNGFGETQGEREEHVLHLCLKGHNLEATSHEFGVKATTIRGRLVARRCLERVAQLVPEFLSKVQKWAQGSFSAVETLRPDDVFQAVIRLAVQLNYGTPQIKTLASKLRKFSSDDERRAYLADLKKQHGADITATQGGQHPASKSRHALTRAKDLADQTLKYITTAKERKPSRGELRQMLIFLKGHIEKCTRVTVEIERQLTKLEKETAHGRSSVSPAPISRTPKRTGRTRNHSSNHRQHVTA